jgi:7-cyano-7-deazaguanine reductase
MLKDCPLGQPTVYVETYSPELLFPIPRSLAREKTGISSEKLPFSGNDLWTGYELSWLNSKGMPQIALASFSFPCTSSNVVESKSFKLYLNSFNQSHFPSMEAVRAILEKDLSAAAGAAVAVSLFSCQDSPELFAIHTMPGLCLDNLDIEVDTYQPNPAFLQNSSEAHVEEMFYTNLLKSNCLATGQPDWGTLLISYEGPSIDHIGFMRYIFSLRRHAGFAEHCIEQIFHDLIAKCCPKKLTVYGRYTRRGGLDINPIRTNCGWSHANFRLIRQ